MIEITTPYKYIYGEGVGVGMKIELSKEKVKRMISIMGKEGFKEWVESMKQRGNEVIVEDE